MASPPSSAVASRALGDLLVKKVELLELEQHTPMPDTLVADLVFVEDEPDEGSVMPQRAASATVPVTDVVLAEVQRVQGGIGLAEGGGEGGGTARGC